MSRQNALPALPGRVGWIDEEVSASRGLHLLSTIPVSFLYLITQGRAKSHRLRVFHDNPFQDLFSGIRVSWAKAEPLHIPLQGQTRYSRDLMLAWIGVRRGCNDKEELCWRIYLFVPNVESTIEGQNTLACRFSVLWLLSWFKKKNLVGFFFSSCKSRRGFIVVWPWCFVYLQVIMISEIFEIRKGPCEWYWQDRREPCVT